MATEVITKWIYPKANPEVNKKIKDLAIETGLSESLVTIFWNRKIRTAKEIKDFLSFSLADAHDPKLLKDMEKVADRIVWHLCQGNKVVLYSDYDADGWGCVIVFVKLLRALGYEVGWFTNTREMGYGLKPEGVDLLVKKYPDVKLIVTADNGIVAFEGIEYATKTLGIEVCVTDHHEPSSDGRLPECSGVVDPKRLDETYPFNGLCGTAVVYKLCQVIYEKLGHKTKECNSMLDIVAIATVADVVPMLDENRAFVREGLKMINDYSKKIWKWMKTSLTDERFEPVVTAKTIGFSYAPAINACSRLLGNMNIPIEAFLLDENVDELEIIDLIDKMRSINEERKLLSTNQTDGVFGLIADSIDAPCYVVWHEELHEGILGIIAGRICEKFNKPVVVLTESNEPGVYKGSGRSINGFNFKEILDDIQARTGILEAYGGHEKAGGVTIREENLMNFRVELTLKADELLDLGACKETVIDLAITDEEYGPKLYDEMKSLEPYGEDFKSPIYGIRDFNPMIETFGGDDKDRHLKFSGKNVEYVCWNSGKDWVDDGKPSTNINCIGEFDKFDTYKKKCQIVTREYSDISFKK